MIFRWTGRRATRPRNAKNPELPGPSWAEERDRARTLDDADPIGWLRDRFSLPAGVIYLDGNSLGAVPNTVADRMIGVVADEWGTRLIRSWTEGWWDAPLRIGGKLAGLVGAEPGEVAVTDSTSINLFKLLVAAARARPDRRVILTEETNFPTDRYLIDEVADMLGLEVRAVPRTGLADALDSDVAVLSATHVDYRSAHMLDMASLTTAAHDAGALVLWDLSHTAGAMPVHLDAHGVDFAVGCGYKFLNGGPGAPAFCFAARRHQAALRQPLVGWNGHARPFGFEPAFEPDPGIARVLCGTPPILSMTGLEAAIDAFDNVDLDAVRAKGIALGELVIELADRHLSASGVVLASPRDARQRGSHVALAHADARQLAAVLIDRGVIVDFRPPDLVRIGLAAPYVRYVDVVDALAAIAEILCA